jgi:hypothetical protein
VLLAFALVRQASASWYEDPEDDGFTLLSTAQGAYACLKSYVKVATAGDVSGSGWTLNYNNSNFTVLGLAVLAFTGVDTDTPVSDHGGAYNDAYSAAAQVATDLDITSAANDQLVFFCWTNDTLTHSGWQTQYQNPSSWSEAFDVQDGAESGTAYAAAHGTASGAGDTGDWSVLRSNTGRWCAAGVALKASPPAAADLFLDGMWG